MDDDDDPNAEDDFKDYGDRDFGTSPIVLDRQMPRINMDDLDFQFLKRRSAKDQQEMVKAL